MLDQSYYRKTDEIIQYYGPKPASLIPLCRISRLNTVIFRENFLHMWLYRLG